MYFDEPIMCIAAVCDGLVHISGLIVLRRESIRDFIADCVEPLRVAALPPVSHCELLVVRRHRERVVAVSRTSARAAHLI